MGLPNLFSAPKVQPPPALPPPVTPAAPNMPDQAVQIGEVRRRIRAMAQLSGGRSGDIATGGGGLASDAATTRKTLLGR